MKLRLESQSDLDAVRAHVAQYHDAVLDRTILTTHSRIDWTDGDCGEYLSHLWDLELHLQLCDHTPPGPTHRWFRALFKEVYALSLDTNHLLGDPDTSVYSADVVPIDNQQTGWRFGMDIGRRGEKQTLTFLFYVAEFEAGTFTKDARPAEAP